MGQSDYKNQYENDVTSAMRRDAEAFREGADYDLKKADELSGMGDEAAAKEYREKANLKTITANDLEKDADNLVLKAQEKDVLAGMDMDSSQLKAEYDEMAKSTRESFRNQMKEANDYTGFAIDKSINKAAEYHGAPMDSTFGKKMAEYVNSKDEILDRQISSFETAEINMGPSGASAQGEVALAATNPQLKEITDEQLAGERHASVSNSEEWNKKYAPELTPENNEYSPENYRKDNPMKECNDIKAADQTTLSGSSPLKENNGILKEGDVVPTESAGKGQTGSIAKSTDLELN